MSELAALFDAALGASFSGLRVLGFRYVGVTPVPSAVLGETLEGRFCCEEKRRQVVVHLVTSSKIFINVFIGNERTSVSLSGLLKHIGVSNPDSRKFIRADVDVGPQIVAELRDVEHALLTDVESVISGRPGLTYRSTGVDLSEICRPRNWSR